MPRKSSIAPRVGASLGLLLAILAAASNPGRAQTSPAFGEHAFHGRARR